MPAVEALALKAVCALWLHADSRRTVDLIHPFRASGKKGFPQKFSRRFPEVKSSVKRTAFDAGEIDY